MSALGWVWNGVKWVVRQVAPMVFKPVEKWPTLDTPRHAFRPESDYYERKCTWYDLYICRKCMDFVDSRAAYTRPPCPEKPPTIIVEN